MCASRCVGPGLQCEPAPGCRVPRAGAVSRWGHTPPFSLGAHRGLAGWGDRPVRARLARRSLNCAFTRLRAFSPGVRRCHDLWVDRVDLNLALLLERARELAVLEEATAEAAMGTPGIVVIEGPAGIGKSSLLAAARHAAGSLGLLVLVARGGELERGLELGPARQLFEPLIPLSDSERAELSGYLGGAAAHLFGFGSS